MHLVSIIVSAAIAVGASAQGAFVGAPTGVDRPLAVELLAVSARDNSLDVSTPQRIEARNDPFAGVPCDASCGSDMHCCLISGIYTRCFPFYKQCSELHYPDALNAAGPIPNAAIVTNTCTSAATTITVHVEPVSPMSAGPGVMNQQTSASSDAPNFQVATETTLHIVEVTATTIVPATTVILPSSMDLHTHRPPADSESTTPLPIIDPSTHDAVSSIPVAVSRTASSTNPLGSKSTTTVNISYAQTPGSIITTATTTKTNVSSQPTGLDDGSSTYGPSAATSVTTVQSARTLDGWPFAASETLGSTAVRVVGVCWWAVAAVVLGVLL